MQDICHCCLGDKSGGTTRQQVESAFISIVSDRRHFVRGSSPPYINTVLTTNEFHSPRASGTQILIPQAAWRLKTQKLSVGRYLTAFPYALNCRLLFEMQRVNFKNGIHLIIMANGFWRLSSSFRLSPSIMLSAGQSSIFKWKKTRNQGQHPSPPRLRSG